LQLSKEIAGKYPLALSSAVRWLGIALMGQTIRLLSLLISPLFLLFLFAETASAAERSLESIHHAWRSALKGVQIYGLALQDLDMDAKDCGLERAALANAVRSGLKDTPVQITGEDLQLFNMFVEVATLQAGDQCASTISLRVSAFADPTYAPLLAAEITPWSQRAILISARDNHPRVINDELAKQAAEFAKVWREQQS
jgi:hypothetical protein